MGVQGERETLVLIPVALFLLRLVLERVAIAETMKDNKFGVVLEERSVWFDKHSARPCTQLIYFKGHGSKELERHYLSKTPTHAICKRISNRNIKEPADGFLMRPRSGNSCYFTGRL